MMEGCGGLGLEWEDKMGVGFLFLGLGGGMAFFGQGMVVGRATSD